MRIKLTNLGKRYNREWIFRNLSIELDPQKKVAITGPNGSGKSTLLQIISGGVSQSAGKIDYTTDTGEPIAPEKIYRYTAICAPYIQVIEEMTLVEFLHFHQKMKPWIPGHNTESIIAELSLEQAAHKQIRYYSSGMKQRVKMAQAVFSDVPVVLLDEPLSNLDEEGIRLYHRLIHQYCMDRTVIISSNDTEEYAFCEEIIDIKQYK